MGIRVCIEKNCKKPVHARNWCSAHYSYFRYHNLIPNSFKHNGRSKHPLYHTWLNMMNRCNNPNSKAFSDYGGRGISVCERWSIAGGIGFQNFIADMGEKPMHNYSIDRIDNDGDYEPGNCRWATTKEQIWNTRSRLSDSYDFSMIKEDLV